MALSDFCFSLYLSVVRVFEYPSPIIVLVVIILLVLIALVGFLFYKQKQDKKEGTEMGDVQDSNPKEAGTADAGGEFDGTMSRQGDNPQPQQATYYEVPRLVQEE